jgi:hypothetical protein
MSFTEFVEKARKVHGNKYEYVEASYTKSEAKLTIICPEHGPFTQQGGSHLATRGCPSCARIRTNNAHNISFEEFLRRARAAHGEKYQYVKSSYTVSDNKLTIICPKHGPFQQSGYSHMQGRGCDKCAHEKMAEKRKMPFAEFVRSARAVHGDKYEYDESSFMGAQDKMIIRCPKHGVFSQRAYSHIKGSGCQQCGHEKSIRTKMRQSKG